MNKYRIAGLNVIMNPMFETLKSRSTDYLFDFDCNEDIVAALSEQELNNKHTEYPTLSLDECEYLWTGADFYEKLLNFQGMFLHASAIAVGGKAFLFSAPCGGGKSTHTALWQQCLGEENAVIINDDKPALRLIDGKFYVYGTPFSGKTDKNANICVPLKAICFIEKSSKNTIRRMSTVEALMQIFNQTLRPADPAKMEKLIFVVDKLLKNIPVYQMGCDVSVEAAKMSFTEMSK
ncbi:MAG: hypothetical protein IKY44_00695 [Clostridia bacterium]|nr:hypothetical protein [Clostridia bacterium]